MIKTSSPTRIDLAGGTLDLYPIFLMIGGCQTVNLAIDIETGAEIEALDGSEIEVEVSDLSYRGRFSSLNELQACQDGEMDLLRPLIGYFQPSKAFRLKSFSESPVGGGLGGSSSLCISLIKAFNQWLGRSMAVDEMVRLAHGIEVQVLRKPGGTQDYFPPALGGLNIIHYNCDGPHAETLDVDMQTLADRLFVVYTGRAHHSGNNNWEVLKAAIESDKATLTQLERIAEISRDMADACRSQNWQQLPDLFHAEYEARSALNPAFTSPEIVQLHKLVLQAGGEAVKICGAGGGGCVVVWAETERHEEIKDQCQKNGFQVLKAKPVASLGRQH